MKKYTIYNNQNQSITINTFTNPIKSAIILALSHRNKT
ncbi:hypothetical protein VFMJ11_A1213 [Aliivibrio fischeri MJ11]|uniref:Uncharacterized protein n=1 Tax=Aliivibrio fischeri (strain MJ11) TaxID=388396 RepID=B5EVN9_ALIFM|nr:hypothetical protein VFMJ11_A1213 [Aliivibrio fischeri MJ11]